MNLAMVDKIVHAVLYEGYMLYPYRPSMKNRHRWTFGTLHPRVYSEARGGNDAWNLQAECLLSGPADARLRIQLRFLQLIDRTVGELVEPTDDWMSNPEPVFRVVGSLTAGQRVFQPWQETLQREIVLSDLTPGTLATAACIEHFGFEAAREIEPVRNDAGTAVGIIMRRRQPLSGSMRIQSDQLEPDLFRVTVQVLNQTDVPDPATETRDQVLARSMLSAHLILTTGAGEFVSLMDPPPRWRKAAGECQNRGVFPVLIGSEGENDAMLASPIILYDHPQVAPESAGDLFDACEIDEMLALRIRTLTDREKQEMANIDEQTRTLLERTESLSPGQMTRLHGAVREFRTIEQPLSPHWPEQHERKLEEVCVGQTTLRPGDCVRLRPRRRADAFDLLLSGKLATIASIEQDYEDRVHVAVTLHDDPGADLGLAGKIGHRFFFLADEVEPLAERQAGHP